jgi:2-hydroxychromene-2-carboxylate isomerase
MPESIDFYFDFASPYGFIAAMKIDAVAARGGRSVRWHPFLLGAVYKQVGQSPPEHPMKRNYVNNLDVFRTAQLARARDPAGAHLHLIEGRDPGARAAYRRYWQEGESTADVEVAIEVATGLGHNRRGGSAPGHQGAVCGSQRCRDRARRLRLAFHHRLRRALLGQRPAGSSGAAPGGRRSPGSPGFRRKPAMTVADCPL